jgi:hypothetical protein
MEDRKRPSNGRLCCSRFNSFGVTILFTTIAFANTSGDQGTNEEEKELVSQNYQFYEKRITGNSCGPETDWPCMHEDGCLVIEKFKK